MYTKVDYHCKWCGLKRANPTKHAESCDVRFALLHKRGVFAKWNPDNPKDSKNLKKKRKSGNEDVSQQNKIDLLKEIINHLEDKIGLFEEQQKYFQEEIKLLRDQTNRKDILIEKLSRRQKTVYHGDVTSVTIQSVDKEDLCGAIKDRLSHHLSKIDSFSSKKELYDHLHKNVEKEIMESHEPEEIKKKCLNMIRSDGELQKELTEYIEEEITKLD